MRLSVTDREILKIYTAEFEFPSQAGPESKLYQSVEVAVRSLLSGRHENFDIHLLNNPSSSQLELRVSVEHAGDTLKAEYVIKTLAKGNTVAYGGLEENDRQIFQFQDRLAEHILTALPK